MSYIMQQNSRNSFKARVEVNEAEGNSAQTETKPHRHNRVMLPVGVFHCCAGGRGRQNEVRQEEGDLRIDVGCE